MWAGSPPPVVTIVVEKCLVRALSTTTRVVDRLADAKLLRTARSRPRAPRPAPHQGTCTDRVDVPDRACDLNTSLRRRPVSARFGVPPVSDKPQADGT